MPDQMDQGFLRDEAGRLVVTTGGDGVGEVMDYGFIRDEETRALVVVGPDGAPIGNDGITPESFGAKGDLRVLSDVAITEGDKTLTSGSAAFTQADVGKTINIRGAGLLVNAGMFTTTIASVTDLETVELTAAAIVTVANAVALYGTDDTKALADTFAAAVNAGLADGSHFGAVSLTGRYMVAGAPTKGGATKGNAQIPLPVIPTTGVKFRLVVNCPGRGAPLLHWKQTAPQVAGATLFSPLIAAEADGEWSVPSVIGGPTVLPEDGGTAGFSNMLFELDGALTILLPRKANHMGMDLGLVAQADLDALSVIANGSAVELKADADAKNWAANGEGLRMPKFHNNDLSAIRTFSAEGVAFGVGVGDHFQADRLALIYCKIGVFSGPIGGQAQHGARIGYFSFEGGETVWLATGNEGGKYPIVAKIDIEDGPSHGVDFIDADSCLRGEVHYANNTSRAPSKTGATKLTVVNDNA